MLWLKGIPGSGKSVLAAKLVDELAKSQPKAPVLFFFFRQIIDANHGPVALLRDWLDQILVYSPPLQKKHKEFLEFKRPLEPMSMDDLCRDLRLAVASISGRVYCIADALVEMDQGNDGFLEALVALGNGNQERSKSS
ncbi:hypothetical protein BCR34DRAFT_42856 [Clohesyomyces aquaticus]|uniref:Nephrocystin 3-like N-terminal domain-containing protein n=1 Tax=Clohesyomyces aquaticus TaxID=1231657 RepID=A0A1Y1Z6C6_9PLEO|nr:hypothetical protein BCR34DRAFT_42856 [Clohesyomyces aquaticus]